MPALGAHQRRHHVQPDAREDPGERVAAVGICGASCLLAHQTTAASATSDTKAWMSAKRRFMAKTAGRDRADRSNCDYPQNGVHERRYPPPLGQASAPDPSGSRGPLPRFGGRSDGHAQPCHADRGAAGRQAARSTRARRTASCSAAPGTSARTTRSSASSERWFAQDDLTGWTPITVPHNWNASDTTENRPTVGWYRKEFTLPPPPKDRKERLREFWKVRFEGNNYRTKVWLNGKPIGGYTGYFPFEALLKNLRKGRNTLVAKVSSLRSNRDLTHWRPAAFNGYGTGGWWNFGGILREVYVRQDRHDRRRGRARAAAPAPGRRARQGRGARRRCATSRSATATCRLVLAGGRPADPLRPGDGARARHGASSPRRSPSRSRACGPRARPSCTA